MMLKQNFCVICRHNVAISLTVSASSEDEAKAQAKQKAAEVPIEHWLYDPEQIELTASPLHDDPLDPKFGADLKHLGQ